MQKITKTCSFFIPHRTHKTTLETEHGSRWKWNENKTILNCADKAVNSRHRPERNLKISFFVSWARLAKFWISAWSFLRYLVLSTGKKNPAEFTVQVDMLEEFALWLLSREETKADSAAKEALEGSFASFKGFLQNSITGEESQTLNCAENCRLTVSLPSQTKPVAVLRQLRCEVHHPPLSLVSASDQIERGEGRPSVGHPAHLPYVYTVYCPCGLWRPSVGGGGSEVQVWHEVLGQFFWLNHKMAALL